MSNQVDWSELNRKTEGYSLSQCSPGQDQAVFCALHQKLSEVNSKVSASLGGPQKRVTFLYIFADSLVVDEPFLPAASTVIVARTLLLEGGDTPLVAPDPENGIGGVTAIQVLTQQVEGGTLQFMTPDGQPSSAQLDGPGPCALRFVAGQPLTHSKGALEVLDLLRHPIAWNNLKASFDAAALLSERGDNRAVALSMLGWIYRCCSLIGSEDSPYQAEALDLAGQAATLILLMGIEGGAPYVPVLSQDYFAQRMAGLLTVVQSYEAKIGQLQTRGDIQAALREISSAMKDVGKAEIEPVRVAAENTFSELDALQKQYDALQWQFVVQTSEIGYKRLIFQRELEQKLMWDKIKAAFDLIQAVVGFAVAVGSLVAGPEAAIAPATAAANNTNKALTEISKAIHGGADVGESLATALESVKKAGEALAKLQKALADIAKTGNALFDTAKKAHGILPKSAKIPDLAAPDWAEIATMDPEMEWNLFEDQIETALKSFVEQKVGGAREYLTSLEVLVQYGKSMSGKGIAIARLQARYLELVSQAQAAEAVEKRWQKLEAESQNDEQKKAALAAVLLQRNAAAKRALLISARAFRNAYAYRWLSEPGMRVSLEMNYEQLNEQFVRIQKEIGDLLSAKPPDQCFDTGELIFPVRRSGGAARANAGTYALLTIPDSQTQGAPAMPSINWTVPIAAPFFQGTVPEDGNLALFIEEGWFYLIGADSNAQGRVVLKVGTSGQYANGYGSFGAWQSFATAPSEEQELDFIYPQTADGTPVDPSAGQGGTPWRPASQVKAFYMTPSPFTQWTARVLDAGSLDGVVALRVRFKGYYHKAGKAQARPAPAPIDKQAQNAAREAVNRHSTRWQETLARLSEMASRDRIQRLRWLDSEVTSDELALVDVGLQNDQAMAAKLAAVRAEILRQMAALPKKIHDAARQACLRWLDDLGQVRDRSSAEQREAIERIGAGIATERASLTACAQPEPAEMAQVEAKLRELEQSWESALPRRATTSVPRPITLPRVDAPVLTMPDEECRRLYREAGNNWFAVKAKHAGDPPTMWQLWAFRKKVVDGLIGGLADRFGFQWESVGSTNLESDYDLSIKTHGKDPETGALVRDYEAVRIFNEAIQAEYGVQPGTLFDTNLYASGPLAELVADGDTSTPNGAVMKAMAEAGQDVGALMKQRRYMSWEDYTDFTRTVVDGIAEKGKSELADVARQQYEEADALFQISVFTVLEAARDLLQTDVNATTDKPELADRSAELAKALSWVKDAQSRINSGDLLEGQKAMLSATLEFEHLFPDVYMRTTNWLYVKRLREVYEIEDRAAAMDPVRDRTALEGLAARIKTLATDAVFFANEAYQSEGPFLHIVRATQAVLTAANKLTGPERDAYIKENMAKELEKLTTNQFLQSFNEQLGDLLKDLRHYASASSPGVGFYRSSKYIERLFDAALLLSQKVSDLDVTIPGASLGTADLKARLAKGLLAARKGQLAFGDNGETLTGDRLQHEIEAYAIEEARAMFGVDNLRDLGARFLELAARVNAHVRATEVGRSMQAGAGSTAPYFS